MLQMGWKLGKLAYQSTIEVEVAFLRLGFACRGGQRYYRQTQENHENFPHFFASKTAASNCLRPVRGAAILATKHL
jgi:hypothetical protein